MKFKEAIELSKNYYENFITRSIYHSNRIEGNTLSFAQTYAIVFNDNSFSLNNLKPREIYEAINLKYALNYCLECIRKNVEINIDVIIRINELINRNINDTSGFRKIKVFIQGADFIPPDPQNVPRLINEELYHYQRSTLSIVEKIANFHIQFEHIHPFEDGNGRTGRLLINYELLKNDLLPIVIPAQKRAEYFEYLANYDVEGMTKMIKDLQAFEQEKMLSYCSNSIAVNKNIEF